MNSRTTKTFDVSLVAGSGQYLSGTVVAPATDEPFEPRAVVVCLPGGSFNQHYWDAPARQVEGYSFAEAIASRGYVAVVLDHIGMGGSSTPEDGDQLTAAFVGDCHALAVQEIRSELREGTLATGLAPCSTALVVGIGHSNGGCVLVHQQGRRRSYDAVGVFGYTNQYMLLPYQEEAAEGMAEAMHRARAETMLQGVIEGSWDSYLTFDTAKLHDLFYWEDVPSSITAARDVFYSKTPRASSIDASIPGRAADLAREIDTPVFLCFGERDVCPDVHLEPTTYLASQDITLTVLPRSAHCHTFASTRSQLWSRFGSWLDALCEMGLESSRT